MFFRLLLLVLLLSLFVGCAEHPMLSKSPAVYETSKTVGYASFYQGSIKSQKNDKASCSVNFDTKARVTNLNSGSAVIVPMNQEGHFYIVKLSPKEAHQLGIEKRNHVPVRIEILKPIHVITRPNLHQEMSSQ